MQEHGVTVALDDPSWPCGGLLHLRPAYLHLSPYVSAPWIGYMRAWLHCKPCSLHPKFWGVSVPNPGLEALEALCPQFGHDFVEGLGMTTHYIFRVPCKVKNYTSSSKLRHASIFSMHKAL